MRSGLMIPLLMLVFAGLGLAAVLLVSGNRERLAARVDAAMPRGASVAPVPARVSAEFRIRAARSPGWRWPRRALNIPIDLPLAHVAAPVWILLAVTALAALAAWGSHFIVSWWLSIADAVCLWIVLARGIFGWELERYRMLLLRQLPDTIHLVISATRAGLPVSESFRTVMLEMASPTNLEFTRVVDEMSLGVAADEALLNLHRRTGVTEYAIFAVTIGVQARSGGRLAETITNLADTVRDRIAIRGKARALSAEARTAAVIMTILPVVSGLVLSLARPDYLSPLFNESRGQNMLVFGVVSLVLGIVTMRQLIRGATRD